MHINIIACEFAPFVVQTPLAEDIVALCRAAVKADHHVSVLIPFSHQIDVDAHSLARRLMPVKATVEGRQLSCHRYDSRTSDGVNVFLLDIEGAAEKPEGVSAAQLFYAAAGNVIGSLVSPPTDVCIAVGMETAGFAKVMGEDEKLARLPVVSVISHLSDDTEESVVRDLESTDRIVLNHGRLYPGTLSERLRPLKEMLSKGHIQWMAKPVPSPQAPIDKSSAKTAFQMAAGLPVRGDIPLVVFFEPEPSSISAFLTKDVQVVAPVELEGGDALAERYGDRLVLRPAAALIEVLEAADGAVLGARRHRTTAALTFGALPIATPALKEDVVDIESTLASGSAIIVDDMSPEQITAGLERLLAAFHSGADFKRLLSRLPGYASTWTKVTYQFEELVREIASEKKRDGQTE